MSASAKFVRLTEERASGRLKPGRQTMRVMVFSKAHEAPNMDAPPTPEQLEAFAAMDRFIEELVKAGVFVAGAGLKNDADAKRVLFDGEEREIIDGPFT